MNQKNSFFYLPSPPRSTMDNDQKEAAQDSPDTANHILDSEPIGTENEKKPVDASTPPDGGLQAWLAVLGGFCAVFASFGWINCKDPKY